MRTEFANHLHEQGEVRLPCLDGLGEVELKIKWVYRWGDFSEYRY